MLGQERRAASAEVALRVLFWLLLIVLCAIWWAGFVVLLRYLVVTVG